MRSYSHLSEDERDQIGRSLPNRAPREARPLSGMRL